ncbi:MAG: pyridoxine 5'-phosphate synthase [marine benthic group bacterium]|jgi:pyridoxine 5-phosphate synthase|nr:pyridoxine 5'-phosphate synthase [Gemmatimonadota bacterium]MCL7961372.1 pyridoxine 5'-phosphate synthase [Candidatus Carthagonibacter metallireducens]MCL7937410.1 pyridoxine 5'-phosphate synthase [Gemmatimonadota bacterium]MCL7965049.1 pyridoxine 5'-phosphate synthase [Gemmatimonadota bacterium]MCL7969964.1 pyridoxine 5'-phosphate synthase [Gemmatimonadota bacterium]
MRLYINVDHIATVRQARGTDEPDPVRAAVLAELGGADGITVHLREDRRHIQTRDVDLLMRTVRTGVNLEIAASSPMVELAADWRPAAVTLVPERREEITTEGGLALTGSGRARAAEAVSRLQAEGVRTSLFIDPDSNSVRAAAEIGADAIELHTGEYANSETPHARRDAVQRLADTADLAAGLGLSVHAGHGLTYENVTPVAGIGPVEELNIGHTIVSRAVFTGLERAVREMKEIVLRARGS